MIEVRVSHLGDVQFEVEARHHRIYCDQPAAAGGFDEGMTPPELFLASLATCAGYYVAEYIKANKLPVTGMKIRATAEKAKNPTRLDDVIIEVTYPHEVETVHREGLRKAVEKCLIHKTLMHSPHMTTEILVPEPVSQAA